MNHVRRLLVDWSVRLVSLVGRSVCHNFQKGRVSYTSNAPIGALAGSETFFDSACPLVSRSVGLLVGLS